MTRPGRRPIKISGFLPDVVPDHAGAAAAFPLGVPGLRAAFRGRLAVGQGRGAVDIHMEEWGNHGGNV